MAYGNEVVLGFVGALKIRELLAQLGFEDPEPLAEDMDKWLSECCDDINMFLAQQDMQDSHRRTLELAGFAFVKALDHDSAQYATPAGPRRFTQFQVELFWDQDMEPLPEQAVLGVSLSSRYVPTFLDWRDEHGTLYPIVFDDEMNTLIFLATEELTRVLPWMTDAKVIVLERHY